jgi:hypothetical protein
VEIIVFTKYIEMSTQIFKSKIPNEIFFSFLESFCVKNDKYYLLNNAAFKKGLLTDVYTPFFEKCKPYYHISKQKYVEGKDSYKKLTTILRQICNYNKITYTSQIKYEKSTYDIVYYVYI